MPAAISRAPSNVVAVPNFGAGQTGFGQYATEFAAVLRQVDGCGAGSHDGDAGSFETLRQSERGLAAELDDDAGNGARLRLRAVDLEDVLERQRLEVQAISGVVVRGDGLGVAVAHDGLVPGLGQRLRRVDTRVVELDALTDAGWGRIRGSEPWVARSAEQLRTRPRDRARRSSSGTASWPRTLRRRCRRSCRRGARPADHAERERRPHLRACHHRVRGAEPRSGGSEMPWYLA